MNEVRKKKIEREIQKTIARLIVSGKVKDPRVSTATIHRVELASDLSRAEIYYTTWGGNRDRKKLAQGLVSAIPYFQSMLGKKMGLRYTPKLYFIWDSAYIKSFEVNRLIDESAPKQSILDSGYDGEKEQESDQEPTEQNGEISDLDDLDSEDSNPDKSSGLSS